MMASGMHWVGTWATAPAPAEGVAFSNQTLRMNARISIGGDTLRVRLSNAYGVRPLTIGSAHIGLRATGPGIVPESDRTLTFGGETSATIAAGALLLSDPVELRVAPLADIAITFFLPGDVPASFGITGRYARQTNYISPPGDFSARGGDAGRPNDRRLVFRQRHRCAGPGRDRRHRGTRRFADRRATSPPTMRSAAGRTSLRGGSLARGGRAMGVMNQGLGGNRILHDIRGDSGLRRFDRDVLAQPGVTHAIVMLGTNDLRNRWAKPEEEVTAEQMIAGLKQMALRAHARGIKIFGGTLTPFEHETFLVGAWTPAREAVRQAVNAWIRDGGAFDAVIDFDKGVRDPEHPDAHVAGLRLRRSPASERCSATTAWATSSTSRCSIRSPVMCGLGRQPDLLRHGRA